MRLILLGTAGCHLCEQAEIIVGTSVLDNLEIVDIAEQEQWQALYALRIPVLLDQDSGIELGWPFDLQDLKKFIAIANSSCALTKDA